MINYVIRRIDSPYIRWPLVVLSALVCMKLFGVPSFRPDKAMQQCYNIDIPKEISYIQTEHYCRCVRQMTYVDDMQKRSQSCIRRIQKNKETLY